MRKSAQFILEKRKKREGAILMTGGTGFLGSHIAVGLLKKGYRVIFLCRSKDGQDARKRIQRLLRWFDFPDGRGVEVIEGSLFEPRFGLGEDEYSHLIKDIGEIFHCAAETTFKEKKRDQIEKVNIGGLLPVLKAAAEGGCYFFHYMSTAYVAGKTAGLCEEKYVSQSIFHNAYEETKYKAEGIVIKTCKEAGIRANIYRPSIVYGDTETGRALKFNALYFPVQTVNYLRSIFEDDIRKNKGLKAREMGVSETDDGKIRLLLRIQKKEGGSVNLVPINFVVAGCMAIMEHCLEGDIFHLVSDRPKTLDELITFTEEFLKITGCRSVPEGDFERQPKSPLENLFDSYINVYQPYLSDLRVFGQAKAAKILSGVRVSCPEFDYDIFARCMKYARDVGWGKRLFPEQPDIINALEE